MTPVVEMPVRELDEEREQRDVERSWSNRRGLRGWLSVTTHHAIGMRYIITAFIFLLAGGIEAALMRIQLARADNHFLGPDRYNELFTTHGTTMMFLFAVPMMEGMAIWLIPMMLGTRNVAFPRLNAFGYWAYLFGALFLYWGVFTNAAPDMGWFAYTPLAGPQYGPGKRVDIWAQMVTFTELSALCVATELIATILKMRAPGMSLNRIPVYCWTMLIQSFMVVFAMPAVMVASTVMLLNDRTIGTHFVNPAEGGDPLLYQHVFWFFGHPEVYIIFLPALGFVSSIVETHCRRAIFGYPVLVLAQLANAFIGFGLWVHHMYATDLPQIGESYFTASSMMIAIASGTQIFCWLATMWSGRIHMRTPMYFVCGFIFIFVLGGLSGIILAAVPLDLQVHDTFFVVAHFHYVLIGGALFPLFGAFYHWFPKFTGRVMDDFIGKINFWILFIGFNLTFFPMHLLGLKGMTRRIYTYPAELGWEQGNALATVGAGIILLGGIVFIVNVLNSRRHGDAAGANPWDAGTLEWATSSPPPPYNFSRIPFVTHRESLWDNRESLPVVTGLSVDTRELISATVTEAFPQLRESSPEPSIWPLLAAIAVGGTFLGSIFTPWALVWGSIPVAIALVGWFWPKGTPEDEK
jgi:cytochrome c oxidase subunit I